MRTKKNAPPAKAFSYLRFSTPEQQAGDSYRRQTDLAAAYAKAHGLILDEELTYRDLGLSGFHGTNAERGELGEFLDAVRKGVVPRGSYLLVENLDRLSRQTARKALRQLEDIIDAGITVVTLIDGREYNATSLDKDGVSLFLAILSYTQPASTFKSYATTGHRHAGCSQRKRFAKAVSGSLKMRIADEFSTL